MNLRFLFLAALPLVAVACNSGSVVAPVSGKVMFDGKPLANAHVAFQPLASGDKPNPGVGSYAFTDADGGYTLRLADSDKPGAAVAKHRVEITETRGGSDDRDPRLRAAPKVIVPAKYNRSSELQFEVKPGGTAAANFDLKSQ